MTSNMRILAAVSCQPLRLPFLSQELDTTTTQAQATPSRASGARIHRAASNHLKTTTNTAATTVRRIPAPVMRPRRNRAPAPGA
ncbi:hypothetical protein D9M72_410890 [compost metagenome]